MFICNEDVVDFVNNRLTRCDYIQFIIFL